MIETNKFAPDFKGTDSSVALNSSNVKIINTLPSFEGFVQKVFLRTNNSIDDHHSSKYKSFKFIPSSRLPTTDSQTLSNLNNSRPSRSISVPRFGKTLLSGAASSENSRRASPCELYTHPHLDNRQEFSSTIDEIQAENAQSLGKSLYEMGTQVSQIVRVPTHFFSTKNSPEKISYRSNKETTNGEGHFIQYLRFLDSKSTSSELEEFRTRLMRNDINRKKGIAQELRILLRKTRNDSGVHHSEIFGKLKGRSSASPAELRNDLPQMNETSPFGRSRSLSQKVRKKYVLLGMGQVASPIRTRSSFIPNQFAQKQINEISVTQNRDSSVSEKRSCGKLSPLSFRQSILNSNDDVGAYQRMRVRGTVSSLQMISEYMNENSKPLDKTLIKELAYSLSLLASSNRNEKVIGSILSELANNDPQVISLVESKSQRIQEYDQDRIVKRLSNVRVLNAAATVPATWKFPVPLIEVATVNKLKEFVLALDEYNTSKKIASIKILEDSLIKSRANTMNHRKELLKKLGDKSTKAQLLRKEVETLSGTVNFQHFQVKDASRLLELHESQYGQIKEIGQRNRIISSKLQDLVQNYTKFTLNQSMGP